MTSVYLHDSDKWTRHTFELDEPTYTSDPVTRRVIFGVSKREWFKNVAVAKKAELEANILAGKTSEVISVNHCKECWNRIVAECVKTDPFFVGKEIV